MSDESSLDRLIRLRIALERILQPYNERSKPRDNPRRLGLAQKWLKNEPNFKRQIVSPLDDQTEGNTFKRTPERYQRI
jgi:hypothetical protein